MVDPHFDKLVAENPELSFAKVDIDQVPVSVHIISDDDVEDILTAKCCRISLLKLVFAACLLFSSTRMAKSSTNMLVRTQTCLPNICKNLNRPKHDYSSFVSNSFFPIVQREINSYDLL